MMPDFPYTNFHELNLDWLINELKKCYSPDNPPPVGEVMSVNGMTGAVVLYTDADVRLPTVEDDTWNIRRYVTDNYTLGIYFQKNGPAQRMDGGNRYNIYDENNPPPYPVTSVNGQTGAITGVYTQDNPPTFPVSSVNGQTGAVVINVPVDSVNGQTGAVVIPVAFKNNASAFLEPTTDVTGAEWGLERKVTAGTAGISFKIENGHVVGYLNFYDNQDQVVDTLRILTPDDIPSSSGVVSVNGSSGVVVLYGTDIALSSTDPTTIKEKFDANDTNIVKLKNDIAIVENGDLATHNISIGQYVVWKGDLYKAAYAVSIGDALSGNIQAVSNGTANELAGLINTLRAESVLIDNISIAHDTPTDYNPGEIRYGFILWPSTTVNGTGLWFVRCGTSSCTIIELKAANNITLDAGTSGRLRLTYTGSGTGTYVAKFWYHSLN